MEQTETTASESTGQSQRSPELVRPVSGRMIAGVARGVADNFGISEWIPRLLFVVTAFMGGLGVALYAAGWAFIRSEDEAEAPAERFFSGASTSRSWIGVALMVLAGIIVLSNFTFLAGEVIWAVAFLVIGLLLYLGYIPAGADAKASSESKEGVQRMTTTDETTKGTAARLAGDSPSGGSGVPPTMPTPTPPSIPARPKERSMLGRLTIGVVLVGLGVLAILDNIASLPIDAQPRHYMALAVTIIGTGLIVGAFVGRARWLILLSAILIPTMFFSPVFEYEWDGRNFDLRETPGVFAEFEGEYSIDVGGMVIDLRQLPWDGEELSLNASVDAGNLEIFLPDGVGIIGEASVDLGRVTEPGERTTSGLGDPTLTWDERGELGTLILDAHVSVGNIEIRR